MDNEITINGEVYVKKTKGKTEIEYQTDKGDVRKGFIPGKVVKVDYQPEKPLSQEEMGKLSDKLASDVIEETKRMFDEYKNNKKHWPQEGDVFHRISFTGEVMEREYEEANDSHQASREFGNFFQTAEEAQMYSLRIESLSKGFIPNDSEEEFFYTWDWQDREPAGQDCRGEFWLMQPKFRKQEECQEWYNTYGASWLYLLNKKK